MLRRRREARRTDAEEEPGRGEEENQRERGGAKLHGSLSREKWAVAGEGHGPRRETYQRCEGWIEPTLSLVAMT